MKRLTALWLLLSFLPWSMAIAYPPCTFDAGDPIPGWLTVHLTECS